MMWRGGIVRIPCAGVLTCSLHSLGALHNDSVGLSGTVEARSEVMTIHMLTVLCTQCMLSPHVQA